MRPPREPRNLAQVHGIGGGHACIRLVVDGDGGGRIRLEDKGAITGGGTGIGAAARVVGKILLGP